MKSMKGQAALVGLLFADVVGIILLVMLQQFITPSAPNFTGITLTVVNNIVPIGGIILLLMNLAYVGMGRK